MIFYLFPVSHSQKYQIIEPLSVSRAPSCEWFFQQIQKVGIFPRSGPGPGLPDSAWAAPKRIYRFVKPAASGYPSSGLHNTPADEYQNGKARRRLLRQPTAADISHESFPWLR